MVASSLIKVALAFGLEYNYLHIIIVYFQAYLDLRFRSLEMTGILYGHMRD